MKSGIEAGGLQTTLVAPRIIDHATSATSLIATRETKKSLASIVIAARDKPNGSSQDGKNRQPTGGLSQEPKGRHAPHEQTAASGSGTGPPEKNPPAPPSPDEGGPDEIRLSTTKVAITKPDILTQVNKAIEKTWRTPGSEFDATHQELAEYLETLESDEMLEVRRRAFWNVLVQATSSLDLKFPVDRHIVVADLASGEFEEAPVLNAFFGGGEYGSVNENVRVIAIENNPQLYINSAKRYGATSQIEDPLQSKHIVLPNNYEFILEDASSPEVHTELPDHVDAVIIRHQDIPGYEQTHPGMWQEMFRQGLSMLDNNGIMLITSYFVDEHVAALTALDDLDCDVISGKNPDADFIKSPKSKMDQYVIVARKRSQDGQTEQSNGEFPTHEAPDVRAIPGNSEPPHNGEPPVTAPDEEPNGPITLSTEIIDVGVPPIVEKINNAIERANEAIVKGEPDAAVVSDVTAADEAEYDAIINSEEMRTIRQQYFWNLLVRTIARTGYTPPQDRPTIVLDLACGDGEADSVLKSFLGGTSFGEENPHVWLFGVEMDEAERTSAIYHNPFDTYIPGDATKLYEHPEIPEDADFVLIRHQNISSDSNTDHPVWLSRFQQGLSRLGENGVMMITSFQENEHRLAESTLRGLVQTASMMDTDYDYKIVISERNEHTAILRGMAFFPDDKYVIDIIKTRKQPEDRVSAHALIELAESTDQSTGGATGTKDGTEYDVVPSLIRGEIDMMRVYLEETEKFRTEPTPHEVSAADQLRLFTKHFYSKYKENTAVGGDSNTKTKALLFTIDDRIKVVMRKQEGRENGNGAIPYFEMIEFYEAGVKDDDFGPRICTYIFGEQGHVIRWDYDRGLDNEEPDIIPKTDIGKIFTMDDIHKLAVDEESIVGQAEVARIKRIMDSAAKPQAIVSI